MNDTSSTALVLPDAWYNKIKWMVTIVLPAGGTLYFALATIWGLPAAEQILGSVLAVQAFLGAIFAISSSQYKNSDARFDGAIVTEKTRSGTKASLEFDMHPEEVLKKDEVLLKVK